MLDRESCTTPGATRPDNGATAACFHTHQKAVGTFPFDYGWLIGTFHVSSFVNRKTCYYKAFDIDVSSLFCFLAVDRFELAV